MKKKNKLSREEKEILEAAAEKDLPAKEKQALEKEEENGASDAVGEAMEEDITLFRELFPEVNAESIPEEVWERVENGESLCASYALYTVKKQKEEERIQTVNEQNAKKAPPKIHHDGKENDYFSPEAVRSMSRSEIKKHYDAILASMEKWN